MTEEKEMREQIRLPEGFLARIEGGFGIPGFDRDAFLASYREPSYAGLRVNTGKVSQQDLARWGGLGAAVPWTEAGYYIEEKEAWTKNPKYYAGLYYIQEPSAMAPAEFLPVEPGMKLLDLCAAPGGKSTRLAERLRGEGFLLANDASASRAQALVKNLTRFGAGNFFVTAEKPDRLAETFPEEFDGILVDAPCSGEGMFRKDPSLIRDWTKRGPAYYVPLQREILSQAVKMLAPGGYLLYSTCTFSEEEDEGNVWWLMAKHPELAPELLPMPDGGVKTSVGCRLFPHLVRGEGHFYSLLRKSGERPKGVRPAESRTDGEGSRVSGPLADFLRRTSLDFSRGSFYENGTSWYFLPENSEVKPGIRYLRTGFWLGEEESGRFEPSQAMAMRLSKKTFSDWVSFSWKDERVLRYLKGETLDGWGAPHAGGDGWCLVLAEDFPLGFAKRRGTQLKNKYEVGWRWQ